MLIAEKLNKLLITAIVLRKIAKVIYYKVDFFSNRISHYKQN